MIEYITGELIATNQDSAIIEQNGMGYSILMPLSAIDNLPRIGSFVKIYTYLHVREDILALYGFSSQDDLAMFKLLITVSGIGPKGALAILSAMTSDDLRFAVLAEDVKVITKAPGVGAKTAKKLIFELKDKLKLDESFEAKLSKNSQDSNSNSSKTTLIRNETVEALLVLGYSRSDAIKAVRNVQIEDGMTSEDLLKLTLKQLI